MTKFFIFFQIGHRSLKTVKDESKGRRIGIAIISAITCVIGVIFSVLLAQRFNSDQIGKRNYVLLYDCMVKIKLHSKVMGIFLGSIYLQLIFAVTASCCFLLFPVEIFSIIWGILLWPRKIFFIL